MELSKLQDTYCIQHNNSQQWTEVDASGGIGGNDSIPTHEIFSTAWSILMRVIAVGINVQLAIEYYRTDQYNYFIWTTICIVVPFFITILIHINMCYQDGEFKRGTCKAMKTLWLVLLSSFFFRYWKSLVYAIKCKQAEKSHNREKQLHYFKLTVREESDVAFIRLFECFLEAAPQKILQISIVLTQLNYITPMQIVAICSYFGSIAWCLGTYHRNNRHAQIDKQNISIQGLVLQLCWHFCVSVSRTLCIAFMVSLFPYWTVVGCLCHALIVGCVTFIVDRPKFAATSFWNLLFCLVLGVVYLFTYISVKDAPTLLKYTLYYLICSLENIVCVLLFILFASNTLELHGYLFYGLCAMALAFYYIGILFMIIYYMYFHPKITARQSKRTLNNR